MSRVVLIGADSLLEHQARILLGDEAVTLAPASSDVLVTRIIWLDRRPELIVFGSMMPTQLSLSLARTLRENSKTKVWVGQGWYDFATPFHFAEYSMNRPGWPEGRTEFHYYDAGHMMYVRGQDRLKLSNDLRDFIRRQK